MKDIAKLIRRFVGILLLSTVLVIVLNIVLLAVISTSQTSSGSPWTTAQETAEALQETETGYALSGETAERLSRENAWAIYIDNATLTVKWHTDPLPDTVPLQYTASDIARLTRGYIDGYPTLREKPKTAWWSSVIRGTDTGSICTRAGIMISSKTRRIPRLL